MKRYERDAVRKIRFLEDDNDGVDDLNSNIDEEDSERWSVGIWSDRVGVVSGTDRKSTRLNSSHSQQSRMPSSA